MRRRGGELLPLRVDDYVITSYEITIHQDQKLGFKFGGVTKVYMGTYKDKAVAVKFLPEGTPWSARTTRTVYKMTITDCVD